MTQKREPRSVGAGDLHTDTFVKGTDFEGGVTISLVMSRNYGTIQNIEVFFDTAYQGPDQISDLVGKTLTFTDAIPEGIERGYERGGTTLSSVPRETGR